MILFTKKQAFEYLKRSKLTVRDFEESKEVQEKLFEIGFTWITGETKVRDTDYPYLFLNWDGFIACSKDVSTFNHDGRKSIYPSEVLSIHITDAEPEFKFKQEVLVRNCDDEWEAAIFAYYEAGNEYCPARYHVFGGLSYPKCIPLEGNEYLMGTDKMPQGK